MTAEQIRDSLLLGGGALDDKIGGPSTALTPTFTRRTVYGKVSRYRLDEYLQLFDFPSPNLSAEKRFTTTVPLQRLFFMNSDFVQQQAEHRAPRCPRSRQHRADPEGVPADLRPCGVRCGDQAGIAFLTTSRLKEYEERKAKEKATKEKDAEGRDGQKGLAPTPKNDAADWDDGRRR